MFSFLPFDPSAFLVQKANTAVVAPLGIPVDGQASDQLNRLLDPIYQLGSPYFWQGELHTHIQFLSMKLTRFVQVA